MAEGGEQAGEAVGLRDAVGEAPLAGRRAPRDIAEDLLPTDVRDEDLPDVYVRPEEHARARQALAEHRLLVLRGRTGTGRNAMARYLLLHELGVELVELARDTEPAQVSPSKDEGQLLARWRPEQAGQLDDQHLVEWRAALERARGYLVVTVDDDVPVPAGVPLVECATVPDLQLVLQQHLAYFLRTRDGLRLRKQDLDWLAGDRVRRRLHRNHELRSTVRLARRLARPLATAPTPDQFRILEQWLEDDDAPERAAKHLLERSADIDHWSFVISLAVFDNGRYQLVADAAGLLARRLAPGDPRNAAAWQPGPARAGRLQQAGGGQYHVTPDAGGLLARRLAPGDPRNAAAWQPGPARTGRLEQAEAELLDHREQLRPFIRAPVARARFKDPELPAAVLDLVWDELDQLRGPVRDWLDMLGGDGDIEVREPTAVAVAYLAGHGFGYVLDLIIEPWARRDEKTREAAALALGALARKQRFSAQVLALLSRWAHGPDPVLRETAAIAYGWSIGRRQPDVALRELRSLARRGDARGLPAVARALRELVRRWRDREVLEELCAWTTAPQRTTWEPAERRLLWTGLAAFLMIARLYEEGRPRRQGLWPLLLVQAEDDPVARERIVTLWRRALADDSLAESAADTLCDWAYQADLQSTPAGDEQPGVRAALRRLLVDVAGGGPGDLGRVRQAVRRCAEAHDDPSEIARKLAGELA